MKKVILFAISAFIGITVHAQQPQEVTIEVSSGGQPKIVQDLPHNVITGNFEIENSTNNDVDLVNATVTITPNGMLPTSTTISASLTQAMLDNVQVYAYTDDGDSYGIALMVSQNGALVGSFPLSATVQAGEEYHIVVRANIQEQAPLQGLYSIRSTIEIPYEDTDTEEEGLLTKTAPPVYTLQTLTADFAENDTTVFLENQDPVLVDFGTLTVQNTANPITNGPFIVISAYLEGFSLELQGEMSGNRPTAQIFMLLDEYGQSIITTNYDDPSSYAFLDLNDQVEFIQSESRTFKIVGIFLGLQPGDKIAGFVSASGYVNTIGGTSVPLQIVRSNETATRYTFFEASTTTDVEETQKNHMKVYPNPASSAVTFESTEPIFVEVFNTNGQRVASQQIQGMVPNSLSVLDFPAGLYTARSIDSKQHVTTQRIVVTH